jgi:hypothetical protein
MDPKTLDQLLGYFLLWRKERLSDPALGEIRRVGVLFARHGYVWTLDVKEWTRQPEFPEIETWFFKRAEDALAAAELVCESESPPSFLAFQAPVEPEIYQQFWKIDVLRDAPWFER